MTTNLVRPPVRTRATPNVTPFTYYDGLTYLEILEALRKWLRDILVPGFEDLVDYLDGEIARLEQRVESNEDELQGHDERIEALETLVQSIIDNSVEIQDAVVAAMIRDSLSETRAALTEFYVPKDHYKIDVSDHGVLGDGVTNDTAALQAVVDSAPDNSVVWAPPGYVMVIDTLQVSKSITVDFSQAKILRNDDDEHTIHAVGEWELTTAVNTVGATGAESILQVQSAEGFSRGDIVKVYSDDPIPNDRSGERGGLMGELMRIGQVREGNTVVLAGKLHDTMATNIRMTKLADISPRILLGDADYTSSGTGNDAFAGGAMVSFDHVIHPYGDLKISRSSHAAVVANSCFEYNINLTLDFAPGEDGYGLSDGASKGGISHITTGFCRHSFTDNTGRRGNLTGDISGYGRSMFATATVRHNGGTSAGSGIDTHSAGYGHTFINCVVSGSRGLGNSEGTSAAYTTRSGNHTFINCVAQGVETGFHMWSEDGNLSTGLRLIGCGTRDTMVPIDASVSPAPQDQWGDNQVPDLVIDGGVYESIHGSIGMFTGVRVHFNDPLFYFKGSELKTTPNTYSALVFFAAPNVVTGKFTLHANGINTGEVTSAVIIGGSNGTNVVNVDIDLYLSSYIRENTQYAVAWRKGYGVVNVDMFNQGGSILPVGDFDSSEIRQRYTSKSALNGGGELDVTAGDSLGIARRAEQVVSIVKVNTTGETMLMRRAQDGAFRGQILNIVNSPSSDANIRINNGVAAWNTSIGAEVFISPGHSFAMMWTGGGSGWVRALGSVGSNEMATP